MPQQGSLLLLIYFTAIQQPCYQSITYLNYCN